VRWTIHGERLIYDSPWVSLALTDIEIPGLRRFEHHVVRMPHPAAGVIVQDPDRGLLLLWRHRFITDSWGWEIPAGRVEPDEDIQNAARREVLEETGWAIGLPEPLFTYRPTNGISDQAFHVFLASGATHVGDPSDPSESEKVEWLPVHQVRQLILDGGMPDGFSLTAITYALAFGRL